MPKTGRQQLKKSGVVSLVVFLVGGVGYLVATVGAIEAIVKVKGFMDAQYQRIVHPGWDYLVGKPRK